MVYSLIGMRVFGKTETDSIEDFKSPYSFEDAFVRPFLPERPEAPARLGAPLTS